MRPRRPYVPQKQPKTPTRAPSRSPVVDLRIEDGRGNRTRRRSMHPDAWASRGLEGRYRDVKADPRLRIGNGRQQSLDHRRRRMRRRGPVGGRALQERPSPRTNAYHAFAPCVASSWASPARVLPARSFPTHGSASGAIERLLSPQSPSLQLLRPESTPNVGNVDGSPVPKTGHPSTLPRWVKGEKVPSISLSHARGSRRFPLGILAHVCVVHP